MAAAYLALFEWMVNLLLTWLLAASVLIGWGLLVQRSAGVRAARVNDLVRAFWLGVVLTLAFLQLAHLFLPVGGACLLAWSAVGAAGLVGLGRGVPLILRDAARAHPWGAVLSVVLAVLFAGNAMGPAGIYDTGLYHLQAVRWNQAYPIVPGLGNLHARLAFNNGNFLLQALALLGPWRASGYGLVNGLLALALTAQAGLSLRRLWRRAGDSAFADAVGALLLVPVAMIVTRSLDPIYTLFVSSLSPDVTVTLLHLSALGYAAHALVRPGTERLLLVTGLLTATVCVKLSSAPFAVVLLLAVTVRHLRTAERPRRAVIAAGGLGALLIGPWMVRGAILSGYPLFPSAVLAVDLPWRMPAEAPTAVREAIRRAAWTAEGVVATGSASPGSWLRATLGRDPGLLVLPCGLLAWGLGWGAVMAFRRRGMAFDRGERPAAVALLVAAAVGLTAWLLAAPDPRLGLALVYSAAIGAVALVARRRLVVATIALAVTALVAVRIDFAAGRVGSFRDAAVVVVLPIPRSPAGHFVMPTPPVRFTTTASGLDVLLPVDGDRVWDAPLPAAPHVRGLGVDLDRVRLRRDGDLAAGFAFVEGD